jgi:hypothetical protein
MLTEGMLESGCAGSIHPAQTVIHGHDITRTLYVCSSISCAGYDCPATHSTGTNLVLDVTKHPFRCL